MKFYTQIVDSELNLESLAAYDKKHKTAKRSKLSTDKIQNMIKQLSEELKNVKTEKKNYLHAELTEAKKKQKQMRKAFENSKEYLEIKQDIERLSVKSDEIWQDVLKTKDYELKETINTKYKLAMREYQHKQYELEKLTNDFKYKNEEHKNIKKVINDLTLLRNDYKADHIEELANEISNLRNRTHIPMITAICKRYDEKNHKVIDENVHFIPNGEYTINNISEIIGPSGEGPRTVIELINPRITYFLKDCYIEENEFSVDDNSYCIIANTKDGEFKIATFTCNCIIDSNKR